ncbi:MAG: hypothetical protein J6C89_04575 [Clostridia bacterium]|nr:hypothetical protein [Clostridia bacterium]
MNIQINRIAINAKIMGEYKTIWHIVGFFSLGKFILGAFISRSVRLMLK